MPLMEYQCQGGHKFEVFYKSFAEADQHLQEICPMCSHMADRIISLPLPAMFYGNPDGWEKPSLTKRYNTKVVSQKEGNDSAVG